MSIRLIPAILFLSAAVWSQPVEATLGGIVISRVTGQPLRNAEVTLQKEGNDEQVAGATTAPDGAFRLRAPEPGRYLLFAQKQGYEARYYTASARTARLGTVLTLAAGSSLADLTIGLNPRSAFAGKISDEDGEPVVHAQVSALRSVYLLGKRRLLPAGEATTDDNGEYRIFDLEPGKYVLQATASALPDSAGRRGLAYVPAFYPNAPRAELGQQLTLDAGQVTRAIDIQLRRASTFSIEGSAGGAGSNATVSLVAITPDGTLDLHEKRPVPVHGGIFQIFNVLPGRYALLAEEFGEHGGVVAGARVDVDVRSDNLRGIEMAFSRGETISGRVVIEGSSQSAAGFQVSLHSAGETLATGNAVSGARGQFQWKSVLPGSYRLLVNGPTSGLYVKSVRIGDREAPKRILDYSQGVYQAEITVVLSANGGTLKGSVKGAGGTGTGGVQVVAIGSSSGTGRVRAAVTDQSGQFEMRGLAPGEYQMLAFEDLEAGAAEDDAFIQRFAGQGRTVRLAEKQNETVELDVIPAEITRAAI